MERIWAEIDVKALKFNIRLLRDRLGSTKLMAVIKADGYGHGATLLAKTYQEERGADCLAVACLSEAMELRDAGITLPLLILGYTPPERAAELVAQNIAQTVYEAEYGRELAKHVKRGALEAHIKVDTGMNRLGVRSAEEVRAIADTEKLNVTGIFTHLASADAPGQRSVAEQLSRFTNITKVINFSQTHCANSGGVVYYKHSWFDMVRSGLLTLGGRGEGYLPVMTLKARVAQVKPLPAGERVSYDGTYTAESDRLIAVVCAGYADGYPRSLSNRAFAGVGGKLAPVIGRVCMDMLMLDVTDAPSVKRGDEVVLFGKGGPSVMDIARWGGTIPYEIFCSVSKRVPRV